MSAPVTSISPGSFRKQVMNALRERGLTSPSDDGELRRELDIATRKWLKPDPTPTDSDGELGVVFDLGDGAFVVPTQEVRVWPTIFKVASIFVSEALGKDPNVAVAVVKAIGEIGSAASDLARKGVVVEDAHKIVLLTVKAFPNKYSDTPLSSAEVVRFCEGDVENPEAVLASLAEASPPLVKKSADGRWTALA